MPQPLWPKLRTKLGVLMPYVWCVVWGAWLAAEVMVWTGIANPEYRHVVWRTQLMGIVVTSLISMFSLPRRPKPAKDWRPESGGIAVILMTGIALAYFFGKGAANWLSLVFPAAILVATAGLAIVVRQFIRRHPGQIGEARFKTD